MKSPAIYTIRQRGQESQFYTYCAGGYSYPFHVAGWLDHLEFDLNRYKAEDEKLSVATLLPQLKGDYDYPEAARGLRLFRAVSDSEAAAHLGRTEPDNLVPLHITIDLDQKSVAFAFNRNCPELDLPDLDLPIHGKHYEAGGASFLDAATFRQMEEPLDSDAPFVDEINEEVYEQLIRRYAAEQLTQELRQGGMELHLM